MKLEEESRSSEVVFEQTRLESTPFTYKRHQNTYYVPVYPRAFLEEVVNIDYERRTVTAKFVLMVTVSLKVDNAQLREFLKEHLILQFGYNQALFIPEHITLENSPFLISRVPTHDRDYVNYRISGAIECTAEFDSMFFPYRRIEVTNHLTIRQQDFREWRSDGSYTDYTVRYNIMMLVEENHLKSTQFLPFSGNGVFGSFKIDQNSSQAVADVDQHHIHRHLDVLRVAKKIQHLVAKSVRNKHHRVSSQRRASSLMSAMASLGRERQAEGSEHEWRADLGEEERELLFEEEQELKPYQHIGFRFTMSSISVGFVWQNEVPIWILSVVTLFLFEAEPNIGNKFSNIILLLVSYISIISNFRRNNTAQQTLTFFEAKLMLLTLVPILLIITTAIDYYHMDRFKGRKIQISENPFAVASIVIVLTCFALTLTFLIFLWIYKFLCEARPKGVKGDQMIDWMNMVELEWGHHKLEGRMKEILRKSQDRMIFSFHHSIMRQNSREAEETIDLDRIQSKAVPVRNQGSNKGRPTDTQ